MRRRERVQDDAEPREGVAQLAARGKHHPLHAAGGEKSRERHHQRPRAARYVGREAADFDDAVAHAAGKEGVHRRVEIVLEEEGRLAPAQRERRPYLAGSIAQREEGAARRGDVRAVAGQVESLYEAGDVLAHRVVFGHPGRFREPGGGFLFRSGGTDRRRHCVLLVS